MAGMFDNFNNINAAFNPNLFQPKYPSAMMCNCDTPMLETYPNKPFELKNSDGSLRGYFWYKGNSILLVFNIEGYLVLDSYDIYITAELLINDLDLTATFYDKHKHEEVITFYNKSSAKNQIKVVSSVTDDGAINIEAIIDINAEISNTIFNKGVYRLGLVASHPCGYCETLFGTDSCIFEVR